jgi:hypothetical protein
MKNTYFIFYLFFVYLRTHPTPGIIQYVIIELLTNTESKKVLKGAVED